MFDGNYDEFPIKQKHFVQTMLLIYDDNRFIITKNIANIFTILVNLFLL